jgi:hypothetical protein
MVCFEPLAPPWIHRLHHDYFGESWRMGRLFFVVNTMPQTIPKKKQQFSAFFWVLKKSSTARQKILGLPDG